MVVLSLFIHCVHVGVRVRMCGRDVRVWVCGVKIVWLDVCEGEGMCVAVTVRMVLQYVVCL